MNARAIDRRAGHLFVFLSLWLLAMSLGALLAPDIRHVHYRAGPRSRSETLLHRIFGSTRAVISQAMMVEADRYFHRGVPHQRTEAPPTFFSVWANDISPRSPGDLRPGEIEEIMPWLRIATLSDPSNVEAYLTTAFWMSREDQPARVLHVLEEAEMNNPYDYRIFSARGFHLFEGLMFEAAMSNYMKALQLWPSHLPAHDTQARLDRAEILAFSGALEEIGGNYDRAIAAYEEVVRLAPERTWVRQRIESLRSGQFDEAAAFWKGFLDEAGLRGGEAGLQALVPHAHEQAHDVPHPPGYCASCRTVH